MDCVSLCVVLVQCCKDILQTTPPSPSVSCLANLFLFVVLLFAYFWAVTDGGIAGLSNSACKLPDVWLTGGGVIWDFYGFQVQNSAKLGHL